MKGEFISLTTAEKLARYNKTIKYLKNVITRLQNKTDYNEVELEQMKLYSTILKKLEN